MKQAKLVNAFVAWRVSPALHLPANLYLGMLMLTRGGNSSRHVQ
jgi:hypothetical protein